MSRPLRIAAVLVVALVASVAAEVLIVNRGLVDETIYAEGLIGVWALLGIVSAIVLTYGAWLAGRYALQRNDDPYSDRDGDG
jgi:hypothetical protein